MTAFSEIKSPLAITMWDFSWLERRWPGAGYEDWDRVLDELCERGYEAVRIDAYPHLIAADPDREWLVLPEWNQNDWGAPAPVRVRPWPALAEFVGKCAERKIGVALSTWFQDDSTRRNLAIASPAAHAAIWRLTLEKLESEGLLPHILYVDCCNEWPLDVWAPFFRPPGKGSEDWRDANSLEWMQRTLGILRERFPALPLTFSFTTRLRSADTAGVESGFLDLIEAHTWMANHTDFYERVGYHYERFETKGYERVVDLAEPLYQSDPEHWKNAFAPCIHDLAEWSRACGLPLVTTEGWAIVDYKDWPGLDWGWVKDLNEWAVRLASSTGRWAAMCTSNFAGPQFVGMWRDVQYHQRLTGIIRAGGVP